MPIKVLPRFLIAALVLSYPLWMHWLLQHRPDLPSILLSMPPALLNAWLAWFFGHTLLAGREPLISTFARMERRQLLHLPETSLPSDIARYTRILTKIWCALFIAMALVSGLLAWSDQVGWWALFTGAISYTLVASLFLGEYGYRRLRFPHYSHAHPFLLAWILIKSGPVWLRRAS